MSGMARRNRPGQKHTLIATYVVEQQGMCPYTVLQKRMGAWIDYRKLHNGATAGASGREGASVGKLKRKVASRADMGIVCVCAKNTNPPSRE